MKFVVFAVLAFTVAASAQSATPKREWKTFTSPDGTFRFHYPDILIRCELKTINEGELGWAQPECIAYHPVCEALPSPKGPLICLAYPRNQHTKSATFEAAAFSAYEGDGSEKECLTGERKISDIIIRGVKFRGFAEADGGMNQSRRWRGYSAFHNGKCYSMGVTVATSDAQSFDPPSAEMSKSDWAAINRAFDQARDSFEFLK